MAINYRMHSEKVNMTAVKNELQSAFRAEMKARV